jgi:hypothetical protein
MKLCQNGDRTVSAYSGRDGALIAPSRRSTIVSQTFEARANRDCEIGRWDQEAITKSAQIFGITGIGKSV